MPFLEPRTLSTIVEGLFFSTSIPQLVLNIRSASKVVAIQLSDQRRGKSGAAFAEAKGVTLLTRPLHLIVMRHLRDGKPLPAGFGQSPHVPTLAFHATPQSS